MGAVGDTDINDWKRTAMQNLLLLTAVLLGLGVAACRQEGPAERAGRNLDNTGQRVQDTINPPQGPAQSAGRKVDRALGNN
jgi:hypothetical protein